MTKGTNSSDDVPIKRVKTKTQPRRKIKKTLRSHRKGKTPRG